MEQMIPDSNVLCHNRSVSSFRDPFNPEAVHYPAFIRSKILIVVGALLMVLSTLPSYWVEQPLQPVLIDSGLSAAGLVFLLVAWPCGLKTDQFGITQDPAVLRRRKFIPWKEVASVETKHLLGGFVSWLGMDSEALVVYSSQGQRVVHGPRHPDRARFVHELELHGVNTKPESKIEAE